MIPSIKRISFDSFLPGNKICLFIAGIVPFLMPISASSQEALGIVNSSYSGINSSWINPANAALSKSRISVNILAGNGFFVSNYLYVHRKDYSFLKPFRVDINDPRYMYIHEYPEFSFTDTIHYYDYYFNDARKNIYFNGRIAGPSIMLRAGNHAFSLFTSFRNNVSGSFLPPDVANFAYRGLDFEPQHHIIYDDQSFEFAALSWIELGAGYAMTFYDDGISRISGGIDLKYLMGTGAAYGTVKNVTYMVPYQDTLIVYNMNGESGMSLPVDYSSNQFISGPLVRGRGFGGDIGFTYERLAPPRSRHAISSGNTGDDEDQYLFRAGVSLLDIGLVKFSDNVMVNEFNDVNNRIWPGLIDYQAESIQHFFRSASYNLLGDSMASLSPATSFSIWLPTALSIQADYNFGRNVYLNATCVQGIRMGSPGVRRESMIGITPRYETPVWAVHLPVSLVDWRNPAIGLALRAYNIVIGTEKLGTFLNLTDVRGMDLYFSIGFSLNPKKETLSGGVSKGRSSGGRTRGCESIREYKRYQNR